MTKAMLKTAVAAQLALVVGVGSSAIAAAQTDNYLTTSGARISINCTGASVSEEGTPPSILIDPQKDGYDCTIHQETKGTWTGNITVDNQVSGQNGTITLDSVNLSNDAVGKATLAVSPFDNSKVKLQFKGTNTITSTNTGAGIGWQVFNTNGSTNFPNSRLTIVGEEDSKLDITSKGGGAGIGTNAAYDNASPTTANLTISNLKATINTEDGGGAAIGSGFATKDGRPVAKDIIVEKSNLKLKTDTGAGIGSGAAKDDGISLATGFTIRQNKLDISTSEGAGIGAGKLEESGESQVSSFHIHNNIINVINEDGAGIGTGVMKITPEAVGSSKLSNFAIDNNKIVVSNTSGAVIGTGYVSSHLFQDAYSSDVDASNLKISNNSITGYSDYGTIIGFGYMSGGTYKGHTSSKTIKSVMIDHNTITGLTGDAAIGIGHLSGTTENTTYSATDFALNSNSFKINRNKEAQKTWYGNEFQDKPFEPFTGTINDRYGVIELGTLKDETKWTPDKPTVDGKKADLNYYSLVKSTRPTNEVNYTINGEKVTLTKSYYHHWFDKQNSTSLADAQDGTFYALVPNLTDGSTPQLASVGGPAEEPDVLNTSTTNGNTDSSGWGAKDDGSSDNENGGNGKPGSPDGTNPDGTNNGDKAASSSGSSGTPFGFLGIIFQPIIALIKALFGLNK